MYDGDRCLVVEVVHSHGNLFGPEQYLAEVDGVLPQIVIEGSILSIFFREYWYSTIIIVA